MPKYLCVYICIYPNLISQLSGPKLSLLQWSHLGKVSRANIRFLWLICTCFVLWVGRKSPGDVTNTPQGVAVTRSALAHSCAAWAFTMYGHANPSCTYKIPVSQWNVIHALVFNLQSGCKLITVLEDKLVKLFSSELIHVSPPSLKDSASRWLHKRRTNGV